MKKFLKALALTLTFMVTGMLLTACGGVAQKTDGPTDEPTDEPTINEPVADEPIVNEPENKNCLVTFNTCGGSNIGSIQVESGKLINKPNNPTKTDYTFAGWYLDIDYNYEFRFPIDTINKDTILYAKWIFALKEYTLSFDTDGGNILSPITQLEGTTLNLPTPTKTGLTFDYWYTSDLEVFDQNYMPSCNVTLYAKWKVPVDIYIDGVLFDTVYTNEENNYSLANLTKPDDITVDPLIQKYFYGYFVDYYLSVPLEETTTFTTDSRIYAKWINIDESKYQYTVSNGKATLTGFNDENTNVLVVPKCINSFPITAISGAFQGKFRIRDVIFLCEDLQLIENNAFRNCTGLTNITIPNSVTILGDSVFEGCSNLTIIIPNGVSDIGDRAFCRCDSLTSITIPDSVTSIGSDAFSGCVSLNGIAIPNNVSNLGSSVFENCTSLIRIYCEVAKEPSGWDSTWKTGCNAQVYWGCDIDDGTFMYREYSKSSYQLVGYIGNDNMVILPSEYKDKPVIRIYNFQDCKSLTSIIIPSSFVQILRRAFADCTNLTHIYCEVSKMPPDWEDLCFFGCNAEIIWGYQG